MRQWALARINTICGNCPTVIQQGQPLLEISAPGWAKVRCEACAGEPVPASIDDQPTAARTIGPRFAERLDSIKSIGRDWKHAQSGEN